MTASASGFDGDAVARLETPATRRLVTDLFDNADRLVAGDHRQTQESVELAVVLIDVAATDAAGFDAHQRVIGTDARQIELLHFESFVADLDDRTRLSHIDSPAAL